MRNLSLSLALEESLVAALPETGGGVRNELRVSGKWNASVRCEIEIMKGALNWCENNPSGLEDG